MFLAPDTHSWDDQTSGPRPWDHVQHRVLDDPPGEGLTREQEFSQENAYAMPINQRSARHWSGHTIAVPALAEKASKILGSQVGRKSMTVVVPPTAAAGAYIDENASTLELPIPQGFYLAIGASLTVETEGALFAISAGADTTLCVSTTWG